MKFEKACKILMIKEPFYGLFLSTLQKSETTKIHTLGVGKNGINVVLHVNPIFWETLSDDEQIAVLKHEMIHICFFHLTMKDSFSNSKLFNIAADMEINQLISNLPRGCVNINDYINQGFKLDKNAGTKYYYDNIKNQIEENKELCDYINDKNGKNGKNVKDLIGNHDQWKDFKDLSESEKTLIENQIDYQLKETVKSINKNNGNIPNELRDKIDSLFKINTPVFNWKSYFRRVIGSSIYVYTKKSLRKLSKRFEDNAGLKIKHKQHVLVAIDTSGSINNDELIDFFSEIYHIYKAGASITIIECDSKIGKIYKYEGKANLKITGGGGTDFAPVINYYNKNRKDYTTLIYFTDGYASLNNFKVMKNMIWLISSNGDTNKKYPGLTIKIPKNE